MTDAELLAALTGLIAKGTSPPPPPVPVPLPPPHATVDLVIDTDMSIDVDDVGALCIANALVDAGEAHLLAVTHDTANTFGVAAIAAINSYYGRSAVPIGTYNGDVGDKAHTPSYWDDWTLQGEGWYTEDLASRARLVQTVTADAVRVLRSTLAVASDDRKVTIAAIGHATNLHALLKSEPDGLSPLNGVELVAAKVKELVWMGGSFYDSHRVEWNFGAYGGDPFGFAGAYADLGTLTNETIDAWPSSVPITYISYEAGASIRVGGVLKYSVPESSPCRQAYMDFCGIDGTGGGLPTWCGKGGRNAWDLMAILLAVRGPGDLYKLVPGRNWIESETGRNVWTNATSDGRAVLNADLTSLARLGYSQFQAHVAPELHEKVGNEIDALLSRTPSATPPPSDPPLLSPPPPPQRSPPPPQRSPPPPQRSPPPPVPLPPSPPPPKPSPSPKPPPPPFASSSPNFLATTETGAVVASSATRASTFATSQWSGGVGKALGPGHAIPPSPPVMPPPELPPQSSSAAPPQLHARGDGGGGIRLFIIFSFSAVSATIFTVYCQRCSMSSVKSAIDDAATVGQNLALEVRASLPKVPARSKKPFAKLDKHAWLDDEDHSPSALRHPRGLVKSVGLTPSPERQRDELD